MYYPLTTQLAHFTLCFLRYIILLEIWLKNTDEVQNCDLIATIVDTRLKRSVSLPSKHKSQNWVLWEIFNLIIVNFFLLSHQWNVKLELKMPKTTVIHITQTLFLQNRDPSLIDLLVSWHGFNLPASCAQYKYEGLLWE